MNRERLKDYFFGAVMILCVIATILVFRPYLVALALGGVLALVALPIYRFLRRFFRSDTVAALLTVMAILIIIVVPSIYFFAALAQEIGSLFSNVSAMFNYGRMTEFLHNRLPAPIQAQIPAIMEQAAGVITSVVKGLSSDLLKLFSNIVGFTLNFLVMMFSTYYLLKDGKKIKKALWHLSPLSDDKDERVFKNVVVTVQAVVVGLLIVTLAVLTAYWLLAPRRLEKLEII